MIRLNSSKSETRSEISINLNLSRRNRMSEEKKLSEDNDYLCIT